MWAEMQATKTKVSFERKPPASEKIEVLKLTKMDDLLVGKDYLLLGNFSEDKKEEEDGKMMVQEEMMGKSEKYMKFLPPRRRRRRRRVKRMYAKDASSLQFVL